jgi:hypothetical protein
VTKAFRPFRRSSMFPVTISKLAALILVAQGSLASPSAQDWQEFSDSLEGRLHSAIPVSAPCFPVVNGQNSTINPTECSAVEAGYTLADFRSARYPAYMFVSPISSCVLRRID